MSDSVLVPLDGSEKSNEALEHAIEEHPEAEITVLYVLEVRALQNIPGVAVPVDEMAMENVENYAEEVFETAHETGDRLGYDGELETLMVEGDPEQVILEEVENFDKIVMGTHGRDERTQNILGSVAERVVRRSTIPVTVVK